jgi:N-acetylglutamate synthase-like GNAT family acetyltransferase
MQIREAQIEDAVDVCQILRRSIVELCRADHRDDRGVLEQWLNNKTPDNVRSWIAYPNGYVFIATEGTTILGVGAVTSDGEITLNYVSPDARFRGVSKGLLKQLEAKAQELGNGMCALTSTETARQFYLSAGYEEQSTPSGDVRSGSGYRMTRKLSPPVRKG